MNRGIRILSTAVAVLSALTMGFAVLAATPVKAPAKPAVKGTQQLDGTQAQFGLTYTLGVKSPINIQLTSAEYTVKPVIIGTEYMVPTFEEKLLVIHYYLHNPNKSDYGVRWNSVAFTAVDATDTNFPFCQSVGIEADSSKANMNLKPGQKINLYTVIKVPANADIPKLIIEGDSRKVLRYDLHQQGKPPKAVVKPLPAPYADPADPKGTTALAIVPATLGEFLHFGALDARVDSASLSMDPIKGNPPKKGHRYLNVLWTIRNISMQPQGMRWNTFYPSLTDTDGVAIVWEQRLLAASRDVDINQDINPKAELRVRTYFLVPDGVTPGTFTLRMGNSGRYFTFDFTGVK